MSAHQLPMPLMAWPARSSTKRRSRSGDITHPRYRRAPAGFARFSPTRPCVVRPRVTGVYGRMGTSGGGAVRPAEAVVHQRAHDLARLGPGEVVALAEIATQRTQRVELDAVLDAFRGHDKAERVA